MHEVGICEGVVETVQRRAGERPVEAIGVRVGAALRVVPDAFAQAFELVAAGTVAADARVEVVTIPVSATCRDCGHAFESEDPTPACPGCGSTNVQAQGGDELTVEWVAYGAEPADEGSGTTTANATNEVG